MVARENSDDAIRLAELDGAQHHALITIQGHNADLPLRDMPSDRRREPDTARDISFDAFQ